MRSIILGGSGFIGTALAQHLLQAGHEVLLVSRRPGAGRGGLQAVGWDELSGHIDADTAIVNLAGEDIAGRWTEQRRQRILQSRVGSGLRLVQAVAQAKAKPLVVVQGSAVGWYGPGTAPVDESAPAGQGFLADVCRQWEPSSAAVEIHGVRRVIVRTGIVLGRGGGMLARMLPAFRAFVGGHPGNGRQMLSWIHLRDQVRAIEFLMGRQDLAGPFNLTAPRPVDMRVFCQAMGKVLNRPSWLPIPATLLRLVLGRMAEEMLLSGQNVLPQRLLDAGFQFNFPNVEAALEDVLG